MRIDGTYRPQTPGMPGVIEGADAAKAGQANQAETAGKAPRAETDKSAESPAVGADSLTGYVAKARQVPAVRADAVAEARRLIASGELDMPQAVQRAAEAIADRGI